MTLTLKVAQRESYLYFNKIENIKQISTPVYRTEQALDGVVAPNRPQCSPELMGVGRGVTAMWVGSVLERLRMSIVEIFC